MPDQRRSISHLRRWCLECGDAATLSGMSAASYVACRCWPALIAAALTGGCANAPPPASRVTPAGREIESVWLDDTALQRAYVVVADACKARGASVLEPIGNEVVCIKPVDVGALAPGLSSPGDGRPVAQSHRVRFVVDGTGARAWVGAQQWVESRFASGRIHLGSLDEPMHQEMLRSLLRSLPGARPAGSAPPVAATQGAAAPAAGAQGNDVLAGRDSVAAFQVARQQQCADPSARQIAKGPGHEIYRFACDNLDTLIVRCEWGRCRVLK
jgi:hypothetical protein